MFLFNLKDLLTMTSCYSPNEIRVNHHPGETTDRSSHVSFQWRNKWDSVAFLCLKITRHCHFTPRQHNTVELYRSASLDPADETSALIEAAVKVRVFIGRWTHSNGKLFRRKREREREKRRIRFSLSLSHRNATSQLRMDTSRVFLLALP